MNRMNNSLKEIAESILNSKQIFIASHINPDGDNLGSSLALYLALKKLSKNVNVLWVDSIPLDYLFLPEVDNIKRKEDLNIEDNYTLITLDSANLDRLGINKELAVNAPKLINIDHHISNTKYGDLYYVDPESSSTGEIIFELIKELDVDLDPEISNCLYTAISSDTGSFMYSNTTSKTHRIVSKLYESGLKTDEININLYQSNSYKRTILQSKVLMELELYYDSKLAIGIVDEEILNSTDTSMEDTEGIVEKIRDIEGIEVAVLIKENYENFKISTRSKRYVNVSKVCEKFNGGGHIRAAGCTFNKENTLEEIKSNFIKEIGKDI